MSHRKSFVLGSILLPVIFVLFMGAKVREEPAAAIAGLHPEEAPYSARGSHLVGTRSMVIDRKPPLEITVWYPASPSVSSDPSITYSYDIKLFAPLRKIAIATYKGQAFRNAPYDQSAGPYPLVILSPGFAMGSAAYAWQAEHLSSYGFVVIAPEHDEQLDPSLLWRSTIMRPQDILAVLSFLDEQAQKDSAFSEPIDRNLVAVIGHSYGGYTALAAGGARLNTVGLEAVCQTAQDTNDPIVFLCDALLPHLAEMAELAGLDAVPDRLWPDWGDPRIGAVVSLAGDALAFDQAGLAEIAGPVMAIGGTADHDSPYMWGTQPTYQFATSPKKAKIALLDAAHMIFTGPCARVRWFMKLVPNEFCSDPAWDKTRAHSLINHFTTAFLLSELKQDRTAASALEPGTFDFPGVSYEAQGY